MKMKAQAAMEYLMTYGWAILIVIIVAAALWALGVFNPSTWTQASATGFSGFQIPSGGWQVSSSQVVVLLKNSAGANINVTGITATYGSGTTAASTPPTGSGLGVQLAANNQTQFTLSGGTFSGPSSGSSYTLTVKIIYDNLETGLKGFTSQGTLTGTAV